MKRTLSFLSALIFLASCQKEKVIDIHPEMIGAWVHYTATHDYHFVIIDLDGYGYLEWYKNGAFDNDTQPKRWFIKDNVLMLGRWAARDERFTIDHYPQTASSESIVGYDTLSSGEPYMVLDGHVFSK